MYTHIKTFLWGNGILRLLGLVHMFFVTPMMMRYLGVENYGIMSFVMSWVGMLSFFCSTGLSEYLETYYAVEKDTEHRYHMLSALSVGIGMLSLVTIGVAWVLWYFEIVDFHISASFFVLVCMWVLLWPIAHLSQSFLLGFSLLKSHYILTFLSGALTIITTLALIYFKMSVWYFVFSGLIVGIIISFIKCKILYQKSLIQYVGFRFSILKNIIPISCVLAINGSVWMIIGFTDRYLITDILGMYHMGLYGMAMFLVPTVMGFVQKPIQQFLDGFINTAIRNDDTAKTRTLFTMRIWFLFFVIAPVVMGLAVYGYPFVGLYVGDDFLPSHAVMLPIAVGVLVMQIVFVPATMVILYDKSANIYFMGAYVMGAIINVVLNIWLIPQYGIMGAGVASVCASIWIFISVTLIIYYKYRDFVFGKSLIGYMMILGGVYTMGYMVWDNTYGIIKCFVFCGISMLLCFVISLLIPESRYFAKDILHKVIYR